MLWTIKETFLLMPHIKSVKCCMDISKILRLLVISGPNRKSSQRPLPLYLELGNEEVLDENRLSFPFCSYQSTHSPLSKSWFILFTYLWFYSFSSWRWIRQWLKLLVVRKRGWNFEEKHRCVIRTSFLSKNPQWEQEEHGLLRFCLDSLLTSLQSESEILIATNGGTRNQKSASL